MEWRKLRKDCEWTSLDNKIELWLKKRQELLALMYRILHLSPFEDEINASDDSELLVEFQANLIEYVSQEQEELMQWMHTCIAAESNNFLFNEILSWRAAIIKFNAQLTSEISEANLILKISELSEALATRMDLEDELIHLYLANTNVLTSLV
jgi:regulator of sigma D